MRVWIDSHEGSSHRIGQPKECPCCGATETFEADVPDDDMAVKVGFGCGAAVQWRSVLWAASDSGSGWCESLVGVTECPSPGGRGTVQLFSPDGGAKDSDDDDDDDDTLADIAARLRWIGYRVQLVPSDEYAAWFGNYQVTGRQAISDFVDHLAASRADIKFLAPEDFICETCMISVEGRPGQQYQNCPKCAGLMSTAGRKPAKADAEQSYREGRDDFLRGVFG